MNTLLSEKILLEKAVEYKINKISQRGKLNEYRKVIIFLKSHNYKLTEINKFLEENGVKIAISSISRYLQKYSATEIELKELEKESSEIEHKLIKDKKVKDDWSEIERLLGE